jgi:hypothetical protein
MQTTRAPRRVATWTILLIIGLLAGVMLVGQLAASAAGPPVTALVREQNVDANGNIKVHEQGTVPVELPSRTHMGQQWQDHVVLITASSGSDDDCGTDSFGVRLLPDGTSASFTSWNVPDGKVFVLTDVDFGMREKTDATWSLGDLLTFEVLSSTASSFDNFWQGTVIVDSAMDAGGETWRSESIESGVVYPAGAAICMRAGKGFEADRNDVSVINLTKLYGYLIDA